MLVGGSAFRRSRLRLALLPACPREGGWLVAGREHRDGGTETSWAYLVHAELQ